MMSKLFAPEAVMFTTEPGESLADSRARLASSLIMSGNVIDFLSQFILC